MSAGPERVPATFWLLEAPDSLAQQSRREPDGTGLGTFSADGNPQVFKQPLAAYEDQCFASEARDVTSRTFVAHVRYALTGAIAPENTHPFEQADRLFAHNGVIGDLPRLEAELGDALALVHGATDSERFVLRRGAGGTNGNRHLEHASASGRIRARCGRLAHLRAVVIATEPMDEDPGWQALGAGELLHVGVELDVSITRPLHDAPAHPLSLAQLSPRAAASQAPSRQA